jgi:hypothetical protein
VCRENADSRLPEPSCPAKAGHPVRRGSSARAQRPRDTGSPDPVFAKASTRLRSSGRAEVLAEAASRATTADSVDRCRHKTPSLRGAQRRGNPGAAERLALAAPGLLRFARNDDWVGTTLSLRRPGLRRDNDRVRNPFDDRARSSLHVPLRRRAAVAAAASTTFSTSSRQPKISMASTG